MLISYTVVAIAGFQQPNYTVNESDGFQEVCVEVFNPPSNEELLFDIILDYETASGSAGTKQCS